MAFHIPDAIRDYGPVLTSGVFLMNVSMVCWGRTFVVQQARIVSFYNFCNLSTCVNSSPHFFCLASSDSSLPEESEEAKEMHPK